MLTCRWVDFAEHLDHPATQLLAGKRVPGQKSRSSAPVSAAVPLSASAPASAPALVPACPPLVPLPVSVLVPVSAISVLAAAPAVMPIAAVVPVTLTAALPFLRKETAGSGEIRSGSTTEWDRPASAVGLASHGKQPTKNDLGHAVPGQGEGGFGSGAHEACSMRRRPLLLGVLASQTRELAACWSAPAAGRTHPITFPGVVALVPVPVPAHRAAPPCCLCAAVPAPHAVSLQCQAGPPYMC